MSDKETNIGLPQKTITEVTWILRKTLWNTTIIYTALKQFHRNIRWIHFTTYHSFSETMSSALLPIIDDTAERIRSLWKDAPWTMSEFMQDATLDEIKNTSRTTEEMIIILYDLYETMIRELRNDIKICAEWWDDGTTDFLTWIMEQFEKTARMLRATIS